MRSDDLNTIEYAIKNLNLLKAQFRILQSYKISDYIDGQIDFLNGYNMHDLINVIEKSSEIYAMFHSDKVNSIISHTFSGYNIRTIADVLNVSNHTVMDTRTKFYNYVLEEIRGRSLCG